MLLRCQTFTEISLHIFWGQKGTDTERPCLLGNLASYSHLRVDDLDMPQAVGFGWEKTQEPKREEGVAGEFLGLGGLAVALCGPSSSRQTHGPPGCQPSVVLYKSKGVYFCT